MDSPVAIKNSSKGKPTYMSSNLSLRAETTTFSTPSSKLIFSDGISTGTMLLSTIQAILPIMPVEVRAYIPMLKKTMITMMRMLKASYLPV